VVVGATDAVGGGVGVKLNNAERARPDPLHSPQKIAGGLTPAIATALVRHRPTFASGSVHLTCLLDFRDDAGSGLPDLLDSDGFDSRSNRRLHFPRGFLRWRGFGLGPSNRSLCRFSFRGLRHLTCLPRLAELPLRSFVRFCTFDDAFLRLAMIVPPAAC
jgi:hypothetical protein